MNSELPEEQLTDLLLNGLLIDLWKAERAYLLARTIGEHFEAVNASEHSALFGHWQLQCSDEQTSAIVRMFDNPSRNYTIRSIPTLLVHLETYAENWRIPQQRVLYNVLAMMWPQSSTNEMPKPELTRLLVRNLRSNIPTDALERLKKRRDKVIAHNEARDPSVRIDDTWGDANTVTAYAKNLVVVVGEGYLGLSGLSHTVNSAQGFERTMQNLLMKIGL